MSVKGLPAWFSLLPESQVCPNTWKPDRPLSLMPPDEETIFEDLPELAAVSAAEQGIDYQLEGCPDSLNGQDCQVDLTHPRRGRPPRCATRKDRACTIGALATRPPA